MNIIFHVDQSDRWATCLANVYNTLKYFEETGEEYQLEIAANAVAVKQCTKYGAEEAQIAEELSHYIKKGVRVVVCQNALTGQNIANEDLLEGVEAVNGVIIELAKKQNEGWAYIRP